MLYPTAGKRHLNSNTVNFLNLSSPGSQTGRARRSLSVSGLFGGKKDNNDKGDEGSKVFNFVFAHITALGNQACCKLTSHHYFKRTTLCLLTSSILIFVTLYFPTKSDLAF